MSATNTPRFCGCISIFIFHKTPFGIIEKNFQLNLYNSILQSANNFSHDYYIFQLIEMQRMIPFLWYLNISAVWTKAWHGSPIRFSNICPIATSAKHTMFLGNALSNCTFSKYSFFFFFLSATFSNPIFKKLKNKLYQTSIKTKCYLIYKLLKKDNGKIYI